jgi:uncharacterized membrane-anchored protein
MPDPISPPSTAEATAIPVWLQRAVDFVKGRQKAVLFAAIALQAVVLVAMIVFHALPYLVGERILLKVVPVDPRDMFRGDYVVLSYDISRVPPGGIDGIPQAGNWWSRRADRDQWLMDRTVYATLEPDTDGRHWKAGTFSVSKPGSGRFIRGTYALQYGQNPIQFGIEAYYVEEGHGLELERLRNARQLSAEIALAPWGQAKLVRLMEE